MFTLLLTGLCLYESTWVGAMPPYIEPEPRKGVFDIIPPPPVDDSHEPGWTSGFENNIRYSSFMKCNKPNGKNCHIMPRYNPVIFIYLIYGTQLTLDCVNSRERGCYTSRGHRKNNSTTADDNDTDYSNDTESNVEPDSIGARCRKKEHYYNGSCYWIPKKLVHYRDGRKICERVFGRSMVVIEDKHEQDFLNTLVNGSDHLWIGLNRLRRCDYPLDDNCDQNLEYEWISHSGNRYKPLSAPPFVRLFSMECPKYTGKIYHPYDDLWKLFCLKHRPCAILTNRRLYRAFCGYGRRVICERSVRCRQNELYYNGKCYFVSKEVANYSQSKEYCESVPGRYLTVIEDPHELNFLRSKTVGDIIVGLVASNASLKQCGAENHVLCYRKHFKWPTHLTNRYKPLLFESIWRPNHTCTVLTTTYFKSTQCLSCDPLPAPIFALKSCGFMGKFICERSVDAVQADNYVARKSSSEEEKSMKKEEARVHESVTEIPVGAVSGTMTNGIVAAVAVAVLMIILITLGIVVRVWNTRTRGAQPPQDVSTITS